MSEIVKRVAKTLQEIDFKVGSPNYSQAAVAIINDLNDAGFIIVHSSVTFHKAAPKGSSR